MGMTNEQYKGFLLDQLEDWEEVLELAKETNDTKVIKKAEKQIKKINEKLKFQGINREGGLATALRQGKYSRYDETRSMKV